MRQEFYLLLLVFLGWSWPASAHISSDDPHFTIVVEGDKKGLHDEEGNVIIPIRYDDLGWSSGVGEVYHRTIGYREGVRWGLIDTKNKKISQPLFRDLLPYEDKLLIASKNTKRREWVYGLINVKGEQVSEFRYLHLTPHQRLLIASISKDGKQAFGVMNSKEQAIIGFKYTAIRAVASERYAVRDKQDRVALFDAEGEALTEFRYDSISEFHHNLAVTHLRGQQGVIDQHGREQLPNQYQRIKITDDRSVSALPFNQWQMLTRGNKPIRTYSFEHMQPVGVNLYEIKIGTTKTFVNSYGEVVVPERWRVARLYDDFAVLVNQGKYGVLRNNTEQGSKVIIPTEYDSVRIDHNYIVAGKKSTKAGTACFGWQVFDQQGNLLSAYAYQEISPLSEKLFAVKRKNHWGYMDTTGQEKISCRYLAVSPFSNGRASVNFVNGQGVIDTRGQWIVKPFKRNGAKLNLTRVNDNLFVFRTEARHYEASQYGLIDRQGRELYQTHHELIDNGHSLWERSEAGRYGLVSYTGRQLLETKYDTVSALQEGKIYTYGREGRYGIVSWDGRILQDLNNNFQELHGMSDAFLGVKINDKYGFVDEWGRLRIANRYDSITHFTNNMAAVKMLGRWGYIDKSEHLVVQPRFDRAYSFRGEVAIVRKKGKYGMVNTEGRTVVPTVYHRIEGTAGNRYLIHLDDPQRGALTGLVSDQGQPLIHPKYESVVDLNNGYVIVGRKGKYGLLTIEGRTTIPMVHQKLIYDPYNEIYLTVTRPSWQQVKIEVEE